MKQSERLNIYGRQPVLEALRSPYKVYEIKIGKEAAGPQINNILRLAEKNNTAVRRLPKNDLQKDVGAVVHQNVTAITERPIFLNDKEFHRLLSTEKNPFLLLLDQVQDPHNLGAIMRTAESAGITALILPEKGSAEVNATVAKTSAGSLFHLKIFRTPYPDLLLDEFNHNNITTIATTPSAGKSLYDLDLKTGLCFVTGSEGKGVRKNIVKMCQQNIFLPQYGKVSSLNASVATAVVLYEALRQRI